MVGKTVNKTPKSIQKQVTSEKVEQQPLEISVDTIPLEKVINELPSIQHESDKPIVISESKQPSKLVEKQKKLKNDTKIIKNEIKSEDIANIEGGSANIEGGSANQVDKKIKKPKIVKTIEKKSDGKGKGKGKGKEKETEKSKEKLTIPKNKSSEDDQNEELESTDRKIRSFKVKLPNKDEFEGRFTGLTPYQAANKALSKYYRETPEPQIEITFSICESTRKSKKSVYTYVGKRQKLEIPVSYKIQDGREITKNYKNSLKKIKKAEALNIIN
jgi:hypothetical protein